MLGRFLRRRRREIPQTTIVRRPDVYRDGGQVRSYTITNRPQGPQS